MRKQREAERQAAIEQARLQQQREEEAEERRRQRRMAAAAPPARAPVKEDVWRRGSPAPPTPTRNTAPLPASDAAPAAGRYRPGAFGGGAGGGGWRAREAAKKEAEASGNAPSRPESPAPRAAPPAQPAPKDDDGFQTVAPKGVWRPKRGGRP